MEMHTIPSNYSRIQFRGPVLSLIYLNSVAS
jgi:hypothetical protein